MSFNKAAAYKAAGCTRPEHCCVTMDGTGSIKRFTCAVYDTQWMTDETVALLGRKQVSDYLHIAVNTEDLETDVGRIYIMVPKK